MGKRDGDSERKYGGGFTRYGGGGDSRDDEPNRAAIKSSFSDITVRHAFIRKVYSIVLIQLCVTLAIILPFLFWTKLREMARNVPWLGLVFCCGALCILIILACVTKARRMFPLNLLLLGCFTVLEAFSLAFSVARSNDSLVTLGIAFGLTVLIVVAFTVFAFQTRIDITHMGGILCLLFLVFCLLSLVWIVVAVLVGMDKFTYNLIQLVFASLGVLLFSAFLVYHTQLLLGGDHRYAISPGRLRIGRYSYLHRHY